ncbi:hypothetical protein [Candidatus Electronema sp. PJ]|uniref:hypothetical protein n=1 Tax=Candidatus Electronema sp. PJ TaxID=3401572 RepID=UPI003AA82771
MLRTCVSPTGTFRVGLHQPSYAVRNLRNQDVSLRLGSLPDGTAVDNQANFPPGDVQELEGRWIYEIPNAFPFHGVTYIDSVWAAARAENPSMICLEPPSACSLSQSFGLQERQSILDRLPMPLKYALAANSTDPDELMLLAQSCCRMEFDGKGQPIGLKYLRPGKADIDDFELFETIANNPYLPDQYKEIMVLRPGVQGNSEIIGRFAQDDTHVFEYLRRNSYIPWGHYAANMAHDAVRYRTSDLTSSDMRGLRHLYYQRMIVTLAGQFGLPLDLPKRSLTEDELESLRKQVLAAEAENGGQHPATLWGWNFGYDFSGSGYRLHASHQMIHQQYAIVPEEVELTDGGAIPSYSCGDQVAEAVAQYGGDFFRDYLRCIRENVRTDNDQQKERSLIVHEDEHVLLFVPKAQTSQWELQLMIIADADGQPVGNVLEADAAVRTSIDQGILLAQHIFAKLRARMVTSLEYSKRIGIRNGQRLLYAFLPKLPWSMGAFSEAQHRYISSHFPEDFAAACRRQI